MFSVIQGTRALYGMSHAFKCRHCLTLFRYFWNCWNVYKIFVSVRREKTCTLIESKIHVWNLDVHKCNGETQWWYLVINGSLTYFYTYTINRNRWLNFSFKWPMTIHIHSLLSHFHWASLLRNTQCTATEKIKKNFASWNVGLLRVCS